MTPVPFPHQESGADWLAMRRSGLIAHAPRVGKTGLALLAAYKRNPRAPILVVGPAVCRSVWRDAVAVWRPDLTFFAVRHAYEWRWPQASECGCVTYELTPETFSPPAPGTIVIPDEAHRLRNPGAGLTQRTRNLCWAAMAAGGAVWPLTGTPIVGYPENLWALLVCMQATDAFGSFEDFVRAFGGTLKFRKVKTGLGSVVYQPYGADWGLATPEAVQRLSRVAIRKTREQVAKDLPPRTVTVLQVELSQDATRLADEALLAIQARGMSLSEAFTVAQVKRVATFPEISRAMAAIAAAKVPALVELVSEFELCGEAVVVGSAHRSIVDGLATRDGWGAISGGVSQRRRDDVLQGLNAGRLKGVACSIASAGVGIDLSAARHIIMADLSWSPGENFQMVERVTGPRQTMPITITYLTSDHPLEHRLRDLIAVKEGIFDSGITPLQWIA